MNRKVLLHKKNNLQRRQARIRVKLAGTARRPRARVFRSLKQIYIQLIDDQQGATLVAASSYEVAKTKKQLDQQATAARKGKIATAYAVGLLAAQKAQEKQISQIVFDRGGYLYHGRVKALAEGLRAGGLVF